MPKNFQGAGRAMDRAIDLSLADEESPYPDRAAFVDAEAEHTGRFIMCALEKGHAIVLASEDGREWILTGKKIRP